MRTLRRRRCESPGDPHNVLVDALLQTRERGAGKLAVADDHAALSYRQLASLAAVLRTTVLQETRCDRVGVLLPASTLFPAAFFGVLWAGRTVIPLNFLLSPDELARVVRDADIDLILTVRHFRELTAQLGVRVLALDELPLKRRLMLQSLRRLAPAPTVDPHDTAVILYTSGTTAEPKGVELTYRNLFSNATDAIASLDIDPNQTFLNILPPFHVFGLLANVIVPVILAAPVYAQPRFSPIAVVRAMADHRITVLLAIPSMFAAILRVKQTDSEAFRGVYLAISGGEPLPTSVRRGFEERFGVVLRQGYGLTETSPVLAAGSVHHWRDGTVGRPIRNVEIEIRDATGLVLGREQDGEIFARGPGVTKGYFRRPEETRRVLSPDGWFATGDIGRLDADGFLSITGRAKEMLIIGGENVFPREIEAVLETHDGVVQAAVIGVPDDLRGEAPIAFVLPRPGTSATEGDLRAHAKRSLAGYKVPRRVIIRDDLPVGPTGKLLKRKLKEWVETASVETSPQSV